MENRVKENSKVYRVVSITKRPTEDPGEKNNKEKSQAGIPKPDPGLDYPVCVAMYDYNPSVSDNDLSFKKGDRLYIIREAGSSWWFAQHKDTGDQGYIPRNHVATPYQMNRLSLQGEKWFFGAIKRAEAEEHLMQPLNYFGSFLVRNCTRSEDDFALSIRDVGEVAHYRIRKMHTGEFGISTGTTFSTIQELVDYYRVETGVLCVNLRRPCLLEEKRPAASSPRALNREWEINQKIIHLVKKLQPGRFSEVWEGLCKHKTPVAIKTLKTGTMPVDKFLQEASTLINLCHENVIQLYAVCTTEEPIFIVMELMQHGSLLDYLRGDGYGLKIQQLVEMSAQVASGMTHLEIKSIVHRDLAARNIQVGENLICKVSNFELARSTHSPISQEIDSNAKLPLRWTAPEAAFRGSFDSRSDVWSFGILLHEMVTHGQIPYPGMSIRKVLECVSQGYHMPHPHGCPESLYRIMEQCWCDVPHARPSFYRLSLILEKFLYENVSNDPPERLRTSEN